MDRSGLLFVVLCCVGHLRGQMAVQNGTSMTLDNGTSLRIDAPIVWTLEAGSSLVNNGEITLGPGTELDEAPNAAITGAGTERTTRELQGPLVEANPGGLGGVITTSASPGTTLIVRGHTPFTDYSGHTSIARWVEFSPANNSGLDADLSLRYEPSELNGLNESEQRVHIRATQDTWWYLPSVVNTGSRTVTTFGLDSLGLFTTFDEDLPNGIGPVDPQDGFALLGSPEEQLYLHVPHGERVRELAVTDMKGSRMIDRVVNLTEGRHPLPRLDIASGTYLLRVNDLFTFTFVQP